jgi:hypothetical protein
MIDTSYASNKQLIDVELLKPAEPNEMVTVVIWRNNSVIPAQNTVIPAQAGIQTKDVNTVSLDPRLRGGDVIVPVVEVVGAAMHRGRVTVMQSPLLNVRAVPESGVDRTDLPSAEQLASISTAKLASSESPLGTRPVQAFRFSTESFRLNLEVSPIVPTHRATIQSIVKMSEHETTMESNITLRLDKNPVFQADVLLPQGFTVRRINIPVRHEYITHTVGEQLILSVYLPEGAQNNLQIIVEGELPEHSIPDQSGITLPKLFVQGIPADKTTATYIVLTDPAFDVRATDLVRCEDIPVANQSWLQAAQRSLARIALRANYTHDFEGKLSLVIRQPDVTVSTITNTSVKRQSIEDTILIY